MWCWLYVDCTSYWIILQLHIRWYGYAIFWDSTLRSGKRDYDVSWHLGKLTWTPKMCSFSKFFQKYGIVACGKFPCCLLHALKEGSCQNAIDMQRLLMITMVSLGSILTEGHKTIYFHFLFGVPLYFIHVHFVIGKHLCAFRMSVFSSMGAE